MSRAASAVGLLFIGAGSLHFARPKMYEAIMPPYLPRHRELVRASGAAEIAGGAAALHPRTRGFARWWLLATLLGVFPANVHMAVSPEQVRGLKVPAPLLWARLPLQALFMAWVWRATEER